MTFSTVSASRRTKSPVYLRAEVAATMAVSQRRVSAAAFTENATVESVSGGSHAAFIAQPVVAAGLILKSKPSRPLDE